MKKKQNKVKAKPILLTFDAIIGLATAKLTPDYQTAKFSLEYLKKAIKIVEQFDTETLTIAIAKDKPLIMGKQDEKDKKLIAGILLAPRVDIE